MFHGRFLFALMATLCLVAPVRAADSGDATVELQREAIRQMASETLEQLYQASPSARTALQKAAGYAVFSNFGMKILVGGGGSGSGIVFTRGSKDVHFMKMVQVQAGLGWRIKKYRQIWVFEKRADLDAFINSGWEFGGETTLSAQVAGVGGTAFAGAVSVRPGVWMYVLDDDGLAADVTVQGAKYYLNADLN